jgi:pyruvate dehydrogenase E2 component (dihydrolipoamide acetyltransferase)
MRKAIAARLVHSSQTAPHFFLRGSARADRLLALRSEINEDSKVKISVNDFVVKAAGRAHPLVPGMNVIWRDHAGRSFDSVDIAVAVGSHQGLTTPVVRDVCGRGLAAIAADTRALAERAHLGTLRQDEIEGGTLTISNLGMYGVEEFSAIINPPQAAILAVGAIRQEPVVHNGELTVGSVLRVTLSVDHRPVDGVIAAQWMNALIDALENPVKILL